MLAKALLGLLEVGNRRTVKESLSENDICGDLEYTTEATGGRESVGDVG